jgi:5-methylcytosine-specific restriction endonuclease McrA
MRLRPQSLERRREERRALKRTKRRAEIERTAAKRTALRSRDEHTGGYGDPPYEP